MRLVVIIFHVSVVVHIGQVRRRVIDYLGPSPPDIKTHVLLISANAKHTMTVESSLLYFDTNQCSHLFAQQKIVQRKETSLSSFTAVQHSHARGCSVRIVRDAVTQVGVA